MTATKINQANSSEVALQVTDVAGNVTSCDPAVVSLNGARHAQRVSLRRVRHAERWVTFANGAPGISRVQVIVDGHQIRTLRLHPGQKVTIGIGSALHRGHTNTITLIATGKPGATATAVIHN